MLANANPLLALALILIAGVAGGRLARLVNLPSVTGQIVIGVAIGQAGLGLLSHEVTDSLSVVTEFALGLIALTIGDHLNVRRLRNTERRLFLLLVTESLITPAVVFGLMLAFGNTHWSFGVLLAAMAVSTAPATIVALVKESHSRGVFVKTLVAAVALNNIACLALFEVAHTASRIGLDPTGDHRWVELVLGPLREVGLAAVIGFAAASVLVLLTRTMVNSERLAGASLTALLVVSGVALYLDVSLLLSCLFLGVGLANLTPSREELGAKAFANLESAIFALFFTLAGMHLVFDRLLEAGLLAGLLLTGRFIGKVLSANIAMRLAGATDRVRRYLGLALVPQAGVAVGLILLVQQDPALASIAELFLAVGLTTVMVNEVVGSILTNVALRGSGDWGKDRARLIDFIAEEDITTDFSANTKDEAIADLVNLVVRTHHLEDHREALLQSVLEREQVESTCLGSGLAIPHGVLPAGTRMVGAMGISREGLPLDTPDQRPVHCMVLLMTPENERDRHLEVLAALARSIGRDANVQSNLFAAKSAAHAYEILHAEEAEDFNYYLGEPEPNARGGH